jgi:hypothetical protein
MESSSNDGTRVAPGKKRHTGKLEFKIKPSWKVNEKLNLNLNLNLKTQLES